MDDENNKDPITEQPAADMEMDMAGMDEAPVEEGMEGAPENMDGGDMEEAPAKDFS